MYIEEEDQDKKTGVAPQATSIGAGGVDPTASEGGTSSPGSPTPASPQPEKNQSFATVQDYLKANTTQGNDLANKFVGKLDNTLSSEKSAIDTGANAFGNEVSAGTVNQNAGLVNEAATTPTAVTGDSGKLSDWMKQYNAAYAGPSSFENSDVYAPVAKAGSEATTNSQLVGDTGGREQLLQNEFNDYGQGNRGLDQALLQNSGRSSEIQAFAPKFGSVGDYLKSASGNAANAVKTGVTTSQATKDAAHTAVDPQLGKLQTTLNDRVATDQATNGTVGSQYKTDLASGDANLITKDLQEGNVPADQITSVVNYLKSLRGDYGSAPDLSQFYNGNPATDINAGNVATPEEYQNSAAYQTLTGQKSVLDPANSTQAGTWDKARAGTDVNSLTDYLKGNLASQDKATLDSAASTHDYLGSFDQNDTTLGTRKATALVDAVKRSGADPASSPLIKSMITAIQNGYARAPGAIPPGLKVFFDTLNQLTH